MGKTMIFHLLKNEFKISESGIGRILNDLKKKDLLPLRGRKPQKKTKKKVNRLRRNERSGFEIDSMVRHVNGDKWYFVNAIDITTRKAISFVTKSHSSKTASHIFDLIDIPVKEVQTDSGSEFLDCFHSHCVKNNINHYFIYPRQPKMNIFIERFNKTLNEEKSNI